MSYTDCYGAGVLDNPPLRGGPFDKNDFLKEINILDDTIVDFAPLVTRFEKQKTEKFLSHPTETA